MAENPEALIKACQKNNAKAQEALYDAYSRMLMGICVRYAGSRYDAEDVLQEVFIKIFQTIQGLWAFLNFIKNNQSFLR